MICGRGAGGLAPLRAACRLGVYLLATFLASTLMHPGHVEADTGQWSKPVKVSGSFGGWFPDVAADDFGNVHVVWNGVLPYQSVRDASARGDLATGTDASRRDTSSALLYSRWDSRAWTTPNDIGLAWRGAALRSSIAVDRSGRLHLIRLGLGRLEPESLGQEDIWYTATDGVSAESVRSWLPPKQITRATQGYYSDIAIDSRGVVHAIWTESSQGAWGIYYTYSADGGVTWSDRVALDGGDFVHWYRAQLKVDAQDRLHVVWELTGLRDDGDSLAPSWLTRAALYALSKDGGRSWSNVRFPPDCLPPYFFCDTPGPGPQQPAVGVDGKGKILLVFREPASGQILYQQSTDGARWSLPTPVPGVRVGVERPFDTYDMVTDSAGHVHLAMVGYPTESDTMSLLHAEWEGQSWAKPSVISASPPFPEYPKLAVGQGNRLHAVWFGGNRPTVDRTPTEIWYSTAQTTASRIAGRSVLVLSGTEVSTVPVATPTSSPPTPHPRPLTVESKAIRATNSSESSPQWLSDLRQHPAYPLVVGVIPVILLLAVPLLASPGLPGILELRLWRRS